MAASENISIPGSLPLPTPCQRCFWTQQVCRCESRPRRTTVLPSLLSEGKTESMLLCCEEHRKDSVCLDSLINQIWFSSLALALSCALVHDQVLMFSLPSCQAGECDVIGFGKLLLSDLVLNCALWAGFVKAG